MSEHWTDRLSEYLDGELSAEETIALEAHVPTCAACRVAVQELRQVIDAAAGLVDREPTKDLWPGIVDRILKPGDVTVLPFRATARPVRRFSFSAVQLAAAAVLLMLLSGGSVWMLSHSRPVPGTEPSAVAVGTQPQTPSEVAAQFVTSTEQSYDGAIRELESLLAANRDKLEPATIEVLERNLATIDTAIAEARAALARDPSNAYLYRHLDNTMMKKIELLRRATSLPRAQT